jgi:hypothetical protein
MISSLRSLQQVAPPPAVPVETGLPEDWPLVAEEIDLILPPDYCELVNVYGSGCFQRCLWPLNPFSEDETLNLVRQAPLLLWAASGRKRQEPPAVPFPVHPEPGGLFPWARTDAGDALYWLTKGPAESWPVVVIYGSGAAERIDRPTTTFLFQWMTGMAAPRLAPPATPGPPPAPFLSLAEMRNAASA